MWNTFDMNKVDGSILIESGKMDWIKVMLKDLQQRPPVMRKKQNMEQQNYNEILREKEKEKQQHSEIKGKCGFLQKSLVKFKTKNFES